MKRFLLAAALCLASLPALAQSLNDQLVLASDTTFQNRVKQAACSAAISVSSDAQTTAGTTTAFDPAGLNVKRHTQAQSIMNDGNCWKLQFSTAIATQSAVINAATANGTVALTPMACSAGSTSGPPACTGGTLTGNADTQQALVTDTIMNTAVAGVYNSFFGGQ